MPLPYLLFLTVLPICYSSDDLVESIILKPSKCWYVNTDGDQLAARLVKILQKSTYAVIVWSDHETIKRNSTSKCDGYIFVRQGYESTTELFSGNASEMSLANLAITVDTNVYMFYEGNDEINPLHYKEFKETTLLNIVFFRVSEFQDFFKFDVTQSDVQEIHSLAARSGLKELFKHALSLNYRRVEALFYSQKWHPSNLNGSLKLGFITYSPLTYKTENGQGGGILGHIINRITKDFNVLWVDLDEIYSKSGNRWLNTISAVNDGLMDGALGVGCMRLLTEELFSSSAVMVSAPDIVLAPKPRPINPAIYLYLSLSWSVWLAFLASLVVAFVALHAAAKFNILIGHEETPFAETMTCIMGLIDVVSGHGTFSPRTLILRVILLNWLIASMLVTTSYSTGYSSFLIEQKYNARMRTIDQVTNSGFKWAAKIWPEATDVIAVSLRSADRENIKLYADNMEPWPGDWESYERLVREGNTVLIERLINWKYNADEMLNHDIDFTDVLEPVEEVLFSCRIPLMISPRTPFGPNLRRRLSAVTNTGLLQYWIDEVARKDKLISYNKQLIKPEPKPLNVHNVQGAFLFLIIGCFIACVCFVVELVCHAN